MTRLPARLTDFIPIKPPETGCRKKPLDFEELLMHIKSSVKGNPDL